MIKVLSTGCPACKVLESKLNNANIMYAIESNEDKILSYGVQTVPVIVEENGNLINFGEAVQLLNTSDGIKRLGG